MWIYLVVFIGGGLGSALRHFINTAGVALLGPHFPAWTVFINVTGSLVMGLLAGYFLLGEQEVGEPLRLFLTTGFLGGYTTFSAFSLDAAALWGRSPGAAVVYVLASVVLSLLAVFVGIAIVRAGGE
jgi:CrcB protein